MSATCRTRSAAGPAIIIGAIGSGLLTFGYLYAISIKSVPLAIVMSLLMWGVVYQGYNAGFYDLCTPSCSRRGSGFRRWPSTRISGRLSRPCFRRSSPPWRPPAPQNIPLTVGALAFGITVIAAVAALSTRETLRIHMNDLGKKGAVPVPKEEYDRLREQSLAAPGLAKA